MGAFRVLGKNGTFSLAGSLVIIASGLSLKYKKCLIIKQLWNSLNEEGFHKKTESQDFIAFGNNWESLMPVSGTFIKIGFNRFLLFNNTRYAVRRFNIKDGYPFPLKLSIACTDKELEKEYPVMINLIDQVYQFSRMYWKSVRQQNLPITIKYPEMVAEIFPHFQGNNIPDFGKNNLWFL